MEDELREETIRKVSEQKAKIDGQGTVELLKAELEDYNAAKSQAEQLYTEKKYREANKQYKICQGILDNASGASEYSMDLRQVDVTSFPKIKLYLSVLNKSTDQAVESLVTNKFLLREKVGNGKEYKDIAIDSVQQMNKNSGLNTAIVADVSASMGSDMVLAQEAMKDFVKSMQFNVKDRAVLYSFADFVNLVEDGAKCVIAFTDGAENSSNSSKDYVIQKAKKYDIPIYMSCPFVGQLIL